MLSRYPDDPATFVPEESLEDVEVQVLAVIERSAPSPVYRISCDEEEEEDEVMIIPPEEEEEGFIPPIPVPAFSKNSFS